MVNLRKHHTWNNTEITHNMVRHVWHLDTWQCAIVITFEINNDRLSTRYDIILLHNALGIPDIELAGCTIRNLYVIFFITDRCNCIGKDKQSDSVYLVCTMNKISYLIEVTLSIIHKFAQHCTTYRLIVKALQPVELAV